MAISQPVMTYWANQMVATKFARATPMMPILTHFTLGTYPLDQRHTPRAAARHGPVRSGAVSSVGGDLKAAGGRPPGGVVVGMMGVRQRQDPQGHAGPSVVSAAVDRLSVKVHQLAPGPALGEGSLTVLAGSQGDRFALGDP